MAIDLNEILDEIEKLEHSDTNWKTCEKLSILYGVRDGIGDKKEKAISSYSNSFANKSEFMRAMEDAELSKALSVLDEHMLAVKALYPKEYAEVIRRIKR